MLSTIEAENILQAWGAFRRNEILQESWYRATAAGMDNYESPPEWNPGPPPHVSPADVDRACWCMVCLMASHRRLHRDAVDHYRDGAKLGYQRLAVIRSEFAAMWARWEHVDYPIGAQ